jgi:hypothetical protein
VPSDHRASEPGSDRLDDGADISPSDAQLPGKIGKPHYELAAAHGGLGSVAEIGGLYILLAAGTNLLPEKFRIKRYIFWMRSVLLVWWIVPLLGMATYARWHATGR